MLTKLIVASCVGAACMMIPSRAAAQEDCQALAAQYAFAQYKAQEYQTAIDNYNNSYQDRRVSIDTRYRTAYNACRSDPECQRETTYAYQDEIYELDEELTGYEIERGVVEGEIAAAYSRLVSADCI